MLTIEFRDKQNNFIKQWPNWNPELIPNKGDIVIIHFGDNNENEMDYEVVERIIDGTEPNKIVCIID